MCIYNISEKLWWGYIEKTHEICVQEEVKKCYPKVLEAIGISKTAVEKCVDGSFTGRNPALHDNPTLFLEQKDFVPDLNIVWPRYLNWPYLKVNDMIIKVNNV